MSNPEGYGQAVAADRADALEAKSRDDALEHDAWDDETQTHWREIQAANLRSLEYKAQDDRLRDAEYERAKAEAAQDRAERADRERE